MIFLISINREQDFNVPINFFGDKVKMLYTICYYISNVVNQDIVNQNQNLGFICIKIFYIDHVTEKVLRTLFDS